MTEPIEHELRALFRDRTTSTQYPPPPLTLDAEPEKNNLAWQRPRRWTLAIAAAAAVVIAVGAVTGMPRLAGTSDSTAGPDNTTTPEAVGSPPLTTPYIVDDELHAGGAVVETTADSIQWNGETVIVTDVYSDEQAAARERARSWLLDGEALVPLDYLDDSEPVLSLDGSRVVARSSPNRFITRLVVYDVASGREMGSIELPVEGKCCASAGFVIVGFDELDRVYFTTPDARSFVWTPPEAQAAPVRNAPGAITQVGPQGALAVTGRFGASARRVLGGVDAGGAFVPGQQFVMPETTAQPHWSPSGEVVAYQSETGPVMRRVKEGSWTRPSSLQLGNGRTLSSIIGFDSETALLMAAESGRQLELLRCDIGGGACQVVADLGGLYAVGDRWIFPDA